MATLAAQSRLDLRLVPLTLSPQIDPCGVSPFVWRVAQQSGIPVGLERAPDECGSSDGPRPELGAPVTARAAFDHLVTVAPNYTWRVMSGVVVIRPRASWDSPASILNQAVEPFTATETNISPALDALSEPFAPRAFAPEDIDWLRGTAPFTVSFGGGTLLDALNTWAASRRDLGWLIDPCAGPEGRSSARLTLSTYEESELRVRTIYVQSPDHPCRPHSEP